MEYAEDTCDKRPTGTHEQSFSRVNYRLQFLTDRESALLFRIAQASSATQKPEGEHMVYQKGLSLSICCCLLSVLFPFKSIEPFRPLLNRQKASAQRLTPLNLLVLCPA